MKRTMKKLLALLAAGLAAVSCIINISGGSWVGVCTEEGIDYTEVRDVAPFNALTSSLPCNVYYSQADKQEVRVESTQEFAGKVLTTVEDGTLKLKLETGRYPKLILRVVVTSPDIEGLTIKGSGNIIQEGTLTASGDLNLKVSGSGDIHAGDIACKDFSARVSGSGSLLVASVACDGFEAAVSGSGHIAVETLTARGDASVHISGSGRTRLHEVTVDGDMDLGTSGSGSILVNGRCRNVDATTSGSGSISGSLSHTGIRTSTTGSGHVNL